MHRKQLLRTSASQTVLRLQSTRHNVGHNADSGSGSLEQNLRFCLSNQLPEKHPRLLIHRPHFGEQGFTSIISHTNEKTNSRLMTRLKVRLLTNSRARAQQDSSSVGSQGLPCEQASQSWPCSPVHPGGWGGIIMSQQSGCKGSGQWSPTTPETFPGRFRPSRGRNL